MPRRPTVVCLIAVLVVSLVPALAEEKREPDSPQLERSIAGVQVSIDPATGRLVPPTPEQRAKLAAALAALIDERTEGLELRRHPDGMLSVDLKGRFRNVAVAVRGTDGNVRLECVETPDALDALFERAATVFPRPAPAAEER